MLPFYRLNLLRLECKAKATPNQRDYTASTNGKSFD